MLKLLKELTLQKSVRGSCGIFFPPDVEQEPTLVPISLANSPILGASECFVDITVNPVAVWN